MTDRQKIALEARQKGYNCAQSVALAFTDVTGMDYDTTARICSAMGTGMGGSRELCGAIAATTLVEGCRHGASPADKAPAMKAAGALIKEFSDANGGCVRCSQLKGIPGHRSCEDLILQAVDIMERSLS